MDNRIGDVVERYSEYISRDNPTAAARVVKSIYDKVQILRDMPEIGYRYRTEEEGEIRILLLYGHYRIAYLIREIEQIDILGVFHGSLDIESYL
jgi:plasmid stabilization system protein ParE